QKRKARKTHEARRKVVVVCEKLNGHALNPAFAARYELGDELGSGGFGFVMSARRLADGQMVAAKFIYRSKIPRHSWYEDPCHGPIPMELYVLLQAQCHPNVIRLLDHYQDAEFFILVTEVHGAPWAKRPARPAKPVLNTLERPASPTPRRAALGALSVDSVQNAGSDSDSDDEPEIRYTKSLPSHDLFEMIETRRRLSERQVRYMLRQLIDALWYLDSLNICHRDIKDENILIDEALNIKLIDFGSAVVLPAGHAPVPVFPPDYMLAAPRPKVYFQRFYGTLQYAPAEVLLSQPYEAEKADVWAVGVLLFTCLTGQTPFRSADDAIGKDWVLKADVSRECRHFLRRCLEKNPEKRATVSELARDMWWYVDLP
ncbi:kinase-like domain-containing protein, partial [Dipodascopsis tothii]|uniref:kinase-like domain-containing protein n=1 Tax=Dipodascopsis tothii TaxID=44089 RepID=UPI0034CEABC4